MKKIYIILFFSISCSHNSIPPSRTPAGDEICDIHLLSKISEASYLLKSKELGLHSGAYIAYKLNDSNVIYKGEVMGLPMFNKGFVVILPQGSKTTIRIDVMDIHSSALTPRTPKANAITNAISTTIEYKILFGIFEKLVTRPFKTLAKEGTVEVVAGLLSKFKDADTLLKRVTRLDTTMTKLGFDLPIQSRIIVNDSPIFPILSGGGPFSLQVPLRNVWSPWKKQKIIALNPILKRKDVLMDEGVLLHERIHAIMDSTYNSKAFTVKNKTANEAFADFLSAHHTNNPVIGLNAVKEGSVIRDIAQGEAEGVKIKDLLNLSSNDHNNSLLISKTLWKLRELTSPEKMDNIAKSLADELNASYEDFLAKFPQVFTKEEKMMKDIHDLTFVFAILSKKVKQELGDDAQNVIRETALKMGIDEKLMNDVAEQVVAAEVPLSNGEKQIATELIIYSIAGGSVMLEGYLVYEILVD